jgi:hypothetical protein
MPSLPNTISGYGSGTTTITNFDIQNLDCSSVTATSVACKTVVIDGETIDLNTIPVIEADIASLEGRMTTAESDIDTLTTDLGTVTSLANATASSLTTTQGTVATNTSNIATNTSNIATNTSNISTLTTTTGTQTTNIAALQVKTQYQTAATNITTFTGGVTATGALDITGGATFATPLTPTYVGTVPTVTQIGYHSIGGTSTTAITTSAGNLATSIPSNGVWLIEAQFNITFSTTVSYATVSISTTSATIDVLRSATMSSNVVATASRRHLTTVFALGATTNVYAVGILVGTASVTNTQMRMTRLA